MQGSALYIRSSRHGGILKRLLFLAGTTILLSACPSTNFKVPPGEIPRQAQIPTADEQYGHEVLNTLTETYPLDYDDHQIARVRGIVSRLTEAAQAKNNPWHVYVLKGDDFKNAAATKGNFIFVWTGMLRVVQDDDELATILAHEIGHVLAGHTEPDPSEEANRILSGIGGRIAGEVVASQGGSWALAANLAEVLVSATLEAVLVNPDTKRKELEADQIGLLLVAEGGIDPQKSIDFWERVKSDPDFSGSPLDFLSTHPTSEERIEHLKEHLPFAQERLQAKLAGNPIGFKKSWVKNLDNTVSSEFETRTAVLPGDGEVWIVLEDIVPVFDEPHNSGSVVSKLPYETHVVVKSIEGRWLHITNPVNGYVKGRDLAPLSP